VVEEEGVAPEGAVDVDRSQPASAATASAATRGSITFLIEVSMLALGAHETTRQPCGFPRLRRPRLLLASEVSDGPDGSGAQEGTRGHPRGLRPLRGGDFLALFGLHLRDLHLAALRGDAHRLGADRRDLADLALHRAERAHEVLPGAEELQLLAADRGPRAG